MSGNDMDDEAKLALLDDLVLREIMDAPDDEVVAEVGAARIAGLRAELSAALARAGRQRLALARAAVALDRARPRRPAPAARPARGGSQGARLTMAARGGAHDVAPDRDGVDEDLAELDAWVEEGRGET